MNTEEIKRQFSQRIRENYEDFLKDWLSREPEELVACAEEISAAKMLSTALPEAASTEDMEFLLQFGNPLEVVRDGWMSYDGADMSDEIERVLSAIEADKEPREFYAPEQEPPAQEQGVTMC